MNTAIRIFIVDGRELVRQGLQRMLEAEESINVVGDFASAEEAFIEMARTRHDLVLMGTQLPRMNWVEAIRHLKKEGSNYDADIVILAESMDNRAEAMEAGATRYLLKDITSAELAQVIKQVYQNKHWVKERDVRAEEAVELVIPPPADAAYLLRFMCQLSEILDDSFASIICSVGSWNRGTTLTIRSQLTTYSTLLRTLANMPEVEKVEEESLATDIFPSFPKKFGILKRSSINPSKRISVRLKETGTARQEVVPVLTQE